MGIRKVVLSTCGYTTCTQCATLLTHTKSGAQYLRIYYLHKMCNITNCTYEKWCSVHAYIYYLRTQCATLLHIRKVVLIPCKYTTCTQWLTLLHIRKVVLSTCIYNTCTQCATLLHIRKVVLHTWHHFSYVQ